MPAVSSRRFSTAAEDGIGHLAERAQRLVAVVAGTEVALGQAVEPSGPKSVDKDPDPDAIAGGERDRFQQLSAGGELAASGREKPARRGSWEVDQRARHQLGDAAAFVRKLGVPDSQRPVEAPLTSATDGSESSGPRKPRR